MRRHRRHASVRAIDDLVITQVNDSSDDPPEEPTEYDGMGFTSGGEPPTGSFQPATWLLIGLGAALMTAIAAAHRKRRWRPDSPAAQAG